MSYTRIKTINGRQYKYLVSGVREGSSVRQKVVKYLADAYEDEVSKEITLTAGSISADKSIFESSMEDENFRL